MDWQGLLFLLLQVFSVLLCLTVHETCHGLAAWLWETPPPSACTGSPSIPSGTSTRWAR